MKVAAWLANSAAPAVIGAVLGWMLTRYIGFHPIPLPADIAGSLAAAFLLRRRKSQAQTRLPGAEPQVSAGITPFHSALRRGVVPPRPRGG